MEEEWDYLMVLDACRYDCFSSLYPKYFAGKLEKKISKGSSTLEWCEKTFIQYYPDVIYISANPYINSITKVSGFNAKIHFYRVIDVWKWGWDDEVGVVPPENVNYAALKYIHRYPDKKMILHYLQPHAPYLSGKFRDLGFPKPRPRIGQILSGVQRMDHNKALEKMLNILGLLTIRAKLRERFTWKLRELLSMPPASPIDAIRRRFGVNGLRQAYSENLNIVLQCIVSFIEKLSGEIVITADHGELLGEKGEFGHPYGRCDPLLTDVPYFKYYQVSELYKSESRLPNKSSSRTNLRESTRLKQRIEILKQEMQA